MPESARRRAAALVVIIGLGVSSCDHPIPALPPAPDALPTSPAPPTGGSPFPPPSPNALVRLEGNVFEYTEAGRRAVPGVRIFVSGRPSSGFLEVTTDIGGRFEVSGVPNQEIAIKPDNDSGYYSPCQSGARSLSGGAVMHVHVASALTLSTTGPPSSMPEMQGGYYQAWGVVFERTTEGKQPVAGAIVDVNAGSDSPWRTPTTLSDAEGRFLLCSAVPALNPSFNLRARKDGFRPGTGGVFVGWDFQDAPVEIELVRN